MYPCFDRLGLASTAVLYTRYRRREGSWCFPLGPRGYAGRAAAGFETAELPSLDPGPLRDPPRVVLGGRWQGYYPMSTRQIFKPTEILFSSARGSRVGGVLRGSQLAEAPTTAGTSGLASRCHRQPTAPCRDECRKQSPSIQPNGAPVGRPTASRAEGSRPFHPCLDWENPTASELQEGDPKKDRMVGDTSAVYVPWF